MRIPSANPYTFRPHAGEFDPWAVARTQLDDQQRILARDARLPNFFRRAATIGVTAGLGAAAAPALLGATGAGASAAPSVASTAGRFTLPNILKFAEIGVPAATQLLGMRAQNRALTRQAAQEQANLQAQIEMAREQETYRRAEADRVAKEDERRWNIDQQNRARELAAAEEERAFQRRLIEERDARNQQRRMRLAQFLGLGR